MDDTGIYLLEAYDRGVTDMTDGASAVVAGLRGDYEVRLLGVVVVPMDEAVLCLIDASEAAAQAAADRLGPGSRLLRVTWAPGDAA